MRIYNLQPFHAWLQSTMSANAPAIPFSAQSTMSAADAPAIPFSARSLLGEANRDVTPQQQIPKPKRKRNGPGKPDPTAEVVAFSAERLLATGIYVCDVCGRGFQREQNLRLHRRTHNLEGSLTKSSSSSRENRKRVYVCPEPSCIHHDPSRALGDITGIKKHYVRKHCERKWKCEKCNRMYASVSDMKMHSNKCSSGKFRCEKCGQEFNRKRHFAFHQEDCSVAHIVSPGVPTMLDRGANDVYNAMLTFPAPHATQPPPVANLDETMGSVNGMHRGQTTDMQAGDGLPVRLEEDGEQRNLHGTLPAPVPPEIDYWGEALGVGLPWESMLFGGNDSGQPSTDASAYMGWRRF